MVEKLYDKFFGTGYWEKQYKQQIVIFAKNVLLKLKKQHITAIIRNVVVGALST